MSVDVKPQYVDTGGSFTEDAPRPPVPGEENDNEQHSGHSTRSCGSLKSHSSGRSSGKKMNDVCHSPCGTPRQSSLGKKLCGDEAPLGFEPEGSASNSPPFTENGSPPYLKWAENINYLLEDSDGVRLFSQFLVQEEEASSNLDFWFACQGFRKSVSPSDTQKIHQLIKVIYRSYIRGDGVGPSVSISAEIKKNIVERITKKDKLDQSIFNEAQREVERHLKYTAYPSFLKSDLYVQYVQSGGDDGSGKTSSTTSSSGSNSTRPMSAVLPTVHEESELQNEDLSSKSQSNQPMTAPLTSETLLATRFSRAEVGKHKKKRVHTGTMSRSYPSGSGAPPSSGGRIPNPYHVSYAPVSAQDSELQSLSSDALTDETMSLTDSSVDGVPLSYSNKKWKVQQRRAMRTGAHQNKDTQLTHEIIPRTDRAPKDRNIAEVDPIAFAAMLTEKLEKVLREMDNMEKIKRLMTEGDELDEHKVRSTETTLSSLMAAAIEQRGVEDNAQSILEEHVSRIWDNSQSGTPSRSPGRHTPTSKSPERAYRKLLSAGYMASPVTYSKGYKRKEKDYISLVSYDSGVSEPMASYEQDICTPQCKHVHHHHHHHHVKSKLDHDGQCPASCYQDQENYSRDSRDSRPQSQASMKRSNQGKKLSDSSSNVYDSGVSVAYDSRSPPVTVPNILHPANEKVMNWMLENDKLTDYSSHPESERSSSHKRSHKTSIASPSQHRQSSKKQPTAYSSSGRDTSSLQSWVGPDVAPPHHKKPSQPIVQDPQMPLMSAPNPMTQLEEAKRRLEKEVNKMPKSRSFTGAVTKENNNNSTKQLRTLMPPPHSSTPSRQLVTSAGKTAIPDVMDFYSTQDTSQSSTTSRDSHKLVVSSAPGTPGPMLSAGEKSGTGPSNGEKTVIGYYMCGDPIPYRTTLDGKNITLKQFKQTITKKGNYRYFCKKACDEFDTGVVHEEITDDNQILPLWENKIVVKVEKVD